MKMPAPDPSVLLRRDELCAALRQILSPEDLVEDEARLEAFAFDGLTLYRQTPLAVALPKSRDEVREVLRLCNRLGVKVVPRGAGTGVSGGALPLADGIVLSLTKLKRILDIDLDNRCVTVEPGVTNLAITAAVEKQGFYYAPDPSSQVACTIGGNVAENSGGVHCLKYGLTTNNVLGVEVVLMNGETVRLGGKHLDAGGYDLLGVMTGSEGLLGVVTEVTVRILRQPESVRAALLGFARVEDAAACVGAIIGAGIIPAGLEMMDGAALRAVEAYCAPGYPERCGRAAHRRNRRLRRGCGRAFGEDRRHRAPRGRHIRALERKRRGAARLLGRAQGRVPCGGEGRLRLSVHGRHHSPAHLARRACRASASSRRKRAFPSSTSSTRATAISIRSSCSTPIAKARPSAPRRWARQFSTLCVEVGGVLTGEHGVGVEKRDLMGLMFNDDDLAQQERVKCAFDPHHRLNPGQDVSDAPFLRRARAHACASRPLAFREPAALLRPQFN